MKNKHSIVLLVALLLSFHAKAKTQALYDINGPHSASYFGRHVSGAGDINNDGYPDFLVGADNETPSPRGRVHAYSGLDGSELYEKYGGHAVSDAGDINNDGYDDFISASGIDGTNGTQTGAAFVYSGLDGSTLYAFYGENDFDNLGRSVSGAGDVDNDGYDDFIIGVPGDNYGSASVYSGIDGGLIYQLDGDASSNRFGVSSSGVGDVNSDGYADFLVGAVPSTAAPGYAHMFSGVDGSILYTVNQGVNGDSFSSSLSEAGDINNDGYPDFIVGDYHDDSAGGDAGAAYVYSGINGDLLHSVYGETGIVKLGYSVSGAGDVNGDGYDDFVAGAPADYSNSGASGRHGAVRVYSGLSGEVLCEAFGGVVEQLGFSVSGVGDLNKDGYDDFIAGAIGAQSEGPGTGMARIFSGKKVFSKANDYTGDEAAGWIWKGESNGLEGVSRTWSPNWATASPGWVAPLRTYMPDWDVSLEYDIETTGDFDGDGDADWLWRSRTDGLWKVWEVESGTRVGQHTPDFFDAAHDWSVVAAGDTDKDGDDDVVLYNSTTGEILIWQMELGYVNKTHSVGTKSGYDVVRIGDFDGDYDMDLLLQLTGGNTLRFWEIENNALVQEHTTQQTGSGFTTQCTGDFNGDGNDDIYLLAADGTSKWFHYVDFVRQAQIFGANQSAWTFYGCGDYDGDGDSDILWTSADGLGINKLFINQNFNNSATYYFNRYGGTNPANPGYGFEYRGNGN